MNRESNLNDMNLNEVTTCQSLSECECCKIGSKCSDESENKPEDKSEDTKSSKDSVSNQ